MTHQDVAQLLSLTGHELRAPAGVLGGYLSLLEKHAAELPPNHQRALAGARRAQQKVIELLDEMRRLAAVWHEPGAGLTPRTPVATIASFFASGATDVVTEVAPEIASMPGEVPLTRDALRTVVDALTQTVVREHGGVLRCRTSWEPRWCHIDVTSSVPPDDDWPRPPFTRYRGGLGLLLVIAFALVEGAGGSIGAIGDERARGLRATLPWSPSD